VHWSIYSISKHVIECAGCNFTVRNISEEEAVKDWNYQPFIDKLIKLISDGYKEGHNDGKHNGKYDLSMSDDESWEQSETKESIETSTINELTVEIEDPLD